MFRGRGRGRGRGHRGGAHNAFERSPPRRMRSPPQRESHYCQFCKVELSSKRLFDEHKESQVHKQKQILIEKALNDGLHFCYTCEKIFPSKIELDAHCLMSRHQPLYRVDEMQDLLKKKEETKKEPEPKPPQPQEPQTEQQMRRAKGEQERHTIVMELNKLRAEDEDYDALNNADRRKESMKKEHFCEVCNVDCISNSNYKVHIESWRHRAEVDKIKDEEKKKFEEEAERQFEQADKEERMKTPSHLIEKNQYFCEVCSVPLTGEKDYLDHLKIRRHLRQVSQMRRPFKCYVCKLETNIEKEFNIHLESRGHINRAFKSQNTLKAKENSKQNEEWVEKKERGRRSRSKERSRDRRKEEPRDRSKYSDRRDDRRYDRRSDRERGKTDEKPQRQDNRQDHRQDIRQGNRQDNRQDIRQDNRQDNRQESRQDNRRVEIVKTPEGKITDLREKIKGEKIVITKPNDLAKVENVPPRNNEKPNENLPQVGGREDLDKRAKELEFETKFKKCVKEFENDPAGLEMRVTKERDNDIAAYQNFEEKYNRLCREEDYIREDLRLLGENDPRKETYIRDMIKIQQEMREVRQELEIREMMIIKRESLYREHVTNLDSNIANKNAPVQDTVVFDYNHGTKEEIPNSTANTLPKQNAKQEDNDLRIQLERERLMKRLGSELDGVDPAIKEKLMAAIYDKDAPEKPEAKMGLVDTKKGQTVKTVAPVKNDNTREEQLKMLSQREKQLEKELAELKKVEKKKITTSLVPQYDDVDEKKEKKRGRRRSRSKSSSRSSSSSASSSESDDSKSRRKHKKSSPGSRTRSRSKQSTSKSRKRRRRSPSRDNDKRKKKYKDDKKKSDRSKSDKKRSSKSSSKSDEKGTRSSKHETQNVIPVIGSTSVNIQPHQQQNFGNLTQNTQFSKRETSLFWKNPAAATPQVEEPPKEDVWDIAFSGGRIKEKETDETLNLFNQETPNPLSQEILNILRNVAPIITKGAESVPNPVRQQPMQPMQQQTSKIQAPEPKRIEPRSPQLKIPTVSRGLPPIFPSAAAVASEKNSPTPVGQQSTTGSRVRSILKKMKEPPPTEAVQTIKTTASESVNTIPGLDSLADKPTEEGRTVIGNTSRYPSTISSINTSLYNKPQSRFEEENLYGNGRESSSIDQQHKPFNQPIDVDRYSRQYFSEDRYVDERNTNTSFTAVRNNVETTSSSSITSENRPIPGLGDPRVDRIPGFDTPTERRETDALNRRRDYDNSRSDDVYAGKSLSMNRGEYENRHIDEPRNDIGNIPHSDQNRRNPLSKNSPLTRNPTFPPQSNSDLPPRREITNDLRQRREFGNDVPTRSGFNTDVIQRSGQSGDQFQMRDQGSDLPVRRELGNDMEPRRDSGSDIPPRRDLANDLPPRREINNPLPPGRNLDRNIHEGDKLPSSRPTDNHSQPPVRREGESNESYYDRYDRYNEDRQRREVEDPRRLDSDRDYPPRRFVCFLLKVWGLFWLSLRFL